MAEDTKTQLVVLGGGPGGYAAAFYAADCGLDVTLVDRDVNPGGVCLYRGCIPSKALLHVSKVMKEARHAASLGIEFGEPKVDLAKLRAWKESVVEKLTGGLGQLSKGRKVNYVRGEGRFVDSQTLAVQGEGGAERKISFEHAIVATGSSPVKLRGFPESPKVWDSTAALELREIPGRMLVVGGGYIGLELGSVYAALGSKVTVVEMTDGLLPGCDRDLAKVLHRSMKKVLSGILLETRVDRVEVAGDGLSVQTTDKNGRSESHTFDAVLVSVGRRPNSSGFGIENTGAVVNEYGFLEVDGGRRTADERILAIGDVAGQPMLAHKASAEARVAVDVLRGKNRVFEPRAIPAVVFTDPEVAWCGLTEAEANAEGRDIAIAKFPWGASGRAVSMDIRDGLTKLIIDKESEIVLGVGLAGPGAGELIGEGALAVEMGCHVEDLELTIHAHPTLSETIMEAASAHYGTATHIMGKR